MSDRITDGHSTHHLIVEEGVESSDGAREAWSSLEKGHKLSNSIYNTCKIGGYLLVSGGHMALVMAKVATMNHCGQNTDYCVMYIHT